VRGIEALRFLERAFGFTPIPKKRARLKAKPTLMRPTAQPIRARHPIQPDPTLPDETTDQ